MLIRRAKDSMKDDDPREADAELPNFGNSYTFAVCRLEKGPATAPREARDKTYKIANFHSAQTPRRSTI
jgi:hypothetical protein